MESGCRKENESMKERFTEEELRLAKSVDLCAVAEALGYTVKRVGKYYTLKEMDSIRIYNRSHWFRWSRQYDKGNNGGSQIDFLRVFANMEVKEAVFWLLDFAGYQHGMEIPEIKPVEVETKEEKPFILPEAANNNEKIICYLVNERGLSRETVEAFIDMGLLYESKQYHNIVFLGKDKDGVVRFASMRGIYDRQGKAFKCDVKGNDKNYGVHFYKENSTSVMVFEAPIDLMSHVELYGFGDDSMLALGGVADHPLETFLAEHSDIKEICLCLDGDEPGVKAANEMAKKYIGLGYGVRVVIPPESKKDYNEFLLYRKSGNLQLNDSNLGGRNR
jgi:hypothetical protein